MTKKGVIVVLIIALLATIVSAQEGDWYYNSQSLLINIDVDSTAQIVPLSNDYSISYINVNLTHVPYETSNQQIIEYDILPPPKKEKNALLFTWQNPPSEIQFGYSTKVKTENEIVQIKSKIPFPIRNLPEELEPFTKPQQNINSDDPAIIKLASKLVEGEDDLYVAVHKIAEWTKNNIEYDLSTLTAEVSQRASWVLENKQGVCDELTSLFIAMLRSLGIPAKFVSGVAYTNSPLFPENWGSHGWAEVYFPDVGWVPYDVTYGEFAYVDPTHVKLKESLDSGEPSIQYRWLAKDIDIKTQKLDIDTEIEKIVGRVKKPIAIDVEILKNEVGFGSYNIIEVQLENLEDYYVSSEIFIARPKEIELEGSFNQNVLLKPREKKSAFWIVRIPKNLQSNFIYTFPISVNTLRNFTTTNEIISSKNEIVYTYSEIQDILNQRDKEEVKTYSKDVDLNCVSQINELYSYEKTEIVCEVENTGNTLIENAEICLNTDCKEIELGISQTKQISFTISNPEEGKKQYTIKLENNEVSKAAYLDLNILDNPNIVITDIVAPQQVNFDNAFAIEFLLEKESASNPENIEVTLSSQKFKNTWTIEELAANRKLIINLIGRDLQKGVNHFEITAKYKDGNGRPYESSASIQIELINVSFIQNIFLAFNGFIQQMEQMSIESLLMVVIGTTIVFIILLLFIFRRK